MSRTIQSHHFRSSYRIIKRELWFPSVNTEKDVPHRDYLGHVCSHCWESLSRLLYDRLSMILDLDEQTRACATFRDNDE
jgi:hypothetical protein